MKARISPGYKVITKVGSSTVLEMTNEEAAELAKCARDLAGQPGCSFFPRSPMATKKYRDLFWAILGALSRVEEPEPVRPCATEAGFLAQAGRDDKEHSESFFTRTPGGAKERFIQCHDCDGGWYPENVVWARDKTGKIPLCFDCYFKKFGVNAENPGFPEPPDCECNFCHDVHNPRAEPPAPERPRTICAECQYSCGVDGQPIQTYRNQRYDYYCYAGRNVERYCGIRGIPLYSGEVTKCITRNHPEGECPDYEAKEVPGD